MFENSEKIETPSDKGLEANGGLEEARHLGNHDEINDQSIIDHDDYLGDEEFPQVRSVEIVRDNIENIGSIIASVKSRDRRQS